MIMTDDELKYLAKFLTYNCVRNNTSLENIHSGITPKTISGDNSDVKVVTPIGEIEWNRVSKITDEQMKELNIKIRNNLYTYLKAIFTGKGKFDIFSSPPTYWGDCKLDQDLYDCITGNFKKVLKREKLKQQGQ